jgi:hypothetical protein
MRTQVFLATVIMGSWLAITGSWLAITAAGQRVGRVSVQVLETGSFHGDEVKARSGEKWLGLYVTEKGAVLRESVLTISRVADEIVDAGTEQRTGKAVSVNHSQEPILLVKNAPMLKPGQALSVFQTAKHELFPFSTHPHVKLKLQAQQYEVRLVGDRRSPEHTLPRNARLLLTDGRITQTLYALKGWDGDVDWQLRWAGDLDGDGKLDLFAALSYHYNVSERRLFLSSQAQPGQLVAEIAVFRTTGC